MEKNSLLFITGYASGTVVLASLVIYMYMLVADLRANEPHTPEEFAWISFYLGIHILCINVCFYIIFKTH